MAARSRRASCHVQARSTTVLKESLLRSFGASGTKSSCRTATCADGFGKAAFLAASRCSVDFLRNRFSTSTEASIQVPEVSSSGFPTASPSIRSCSFAPAARYRNRSSRFSSAISNATSNPAASSIPLVPSHPLASMTGSVSAGALGTTRTGAEGSLPRPQGVYAVTVTSYARVLTRPRMRNGEAVHSFVAAGQPAIAGVAAIR